MKGTTHLLIGVILIALGFYELFEFADIMNHPYMIILVTVLNALGGFNLGAGFIKIINGK